MLTLCLIWSVRPDIAAPLPLTFIAGPFVVASAVGGADAEMVHAAGAAKADLAEAAERQSHRGVSGSLGVHPIW